MWLTRVIRCKGTNGMCLYWLREKNLERSIGFVHSSTRIFETMLQCGRYRLSSIRSFSFPTVRRLLSTFQHDSTVETRPRSDPIRGVVQSPVNTSIFEPYDVIVIGGGHAGCEGNPSVEIIRIVMTMFALLAAHASARMGVRTLLVGSAGFLRKHHSPNVEIFRSRTS